MKKTYFRVKIFEGFNTLCETIVTMAAKANGGIQKITLADLKTVADGKKFEFTALYGDTTAEIIGDRLLHIDRKVGDEVKTVCVIEEVEIFELTTGNDELVDATEPMGAYSD